MVEEESAEAEVDAEGENGAELDPAEGEDEEGTERARITGSRGTDLAELHGIAAELELRATGQHCLEVHLLALEALLLQGRKGSGSRPFSEATPLRQTVMWW